MRSQFQPLITSKLPQLPWQKVGTEFKQKSYLLIVDYYWRFVETWGTSAETVISHTKSIFARHGIPEVVISDNGPQFSSEAYKHFAEDYQFKHVTSSPYYPRSNGEAERAVGTVKRLIEKEGDPYLALLAYRSTPLQNGYSPSELLMCQKLRGIVPITREQLQPKVPDEERLKCQDTKAKARQKKDFDRYHRAKETLPLSPGERVWIPDRESEALVGSEVAPRSYEFTTTDGSTVRRNQSSVRRLPESPQSDQAGVEESPHDPTQGNHDPTEGNPGSGPETETNEPDRSTLETSPPEVPETVLVRRSTRARKARDRWEPRWSSRGREM